MIMRFQNINNKGSLRVFLTKEENSYTKFILNKMDGRALELSKTKQ